MPVAYLHSMGEVRVGEINFDGDEIDVQFENPRMYGVFTFRRVGRYIAYLMDLRDEQELKLTIGKKATAILERIVNEALNLDVDDKYSNMKD